MVGTDLYHQALTIQFWTNSVDSYRGVNIDKVRVCSSTYVPTDPPFAIEKDRESGVLLGTHDTIYYRYPTNGTGASHKTVIDLFPAGLNRWQDLGGTDLNFDLFVRCNALPTPSTFFARSIGGLAQESLTVSNAGCFGTWYIAVNSHQGAGGFNLVVSDYDTQQEYWPTYCVDEALDASQRSDLATRLRLAARAFCSSAEGIARVATIDVLTETPCVAGCDICAPNNWGLPPEDVWWCGTSPFGSGPVLLATWQDSSYCLAHEWGHRYFSPDDEYHVNDDDHDATCGHTVMAGGYYGVNYNYCWDGDHPNDGVPDAGPPAPGLSAWTDLHDGNSSDDWEPSHTPDNALHQMLPVDIYIDFVWYP